MQVKLDEHPYAPIKIHAEPAMPQGLYGIMTDKGMTLKGLDGASEQPPLTWEMIEKAMRKAATRGDAFSPPQLALPPSEVHAPRPSESGPGLRAQPGRYTEPGNTIIYCDNGNDDI